MYSQVILSIFPSCSLSLSKHSISGVTHPSECSRLPCSLWAHSTLKRKSSLLCLSLSLSLSLHLCPPLPILPPPLSILYLKHVLASRRGGNSEHVKKEWRNLVQRKFGSKSQIPLQNLVPPSPYNLPPFVRPVPPPEGGGGTVMKDGSPTWGGGGVAPQNCTIVSQCKSASVPGKKLVPLAPSIFYAFRAK